MQRKLTTNTNLLKPTTFVKILYVSTTKVVLILVALVTPNTPAIVKTKKLSAVRSISVGFCWL